MANDNSRFNRQLVSLVLASFIIFALAVVLRSGLGATSYETTDSAGRPMGFNDPLYWEHYPIMVSNFRLRAFFQLEYLYEWVLLAAHVAGAGLLLAGARVSTRLIRWYFAIQPLLFPLGIPSLLIGPLIVVGLFTGGTDREGFVDIPFILIVSQSFWVLTSLFVAIALRGPGLGMRQIWSAAAQAARAGTRTFVAACR